MELTSTKKMLEVACYFCIYGIGITLHASNIEPLTAKDVATSLGSQLVKMLFFMP